MDLGLSDEQRQLVASFSSLLGKQSSIERVRAAEPLGFDASLWRSLVDVGAVTMAVPEGDGGWGATLVDLALVAEQVGRALAPAPIIEAQVAARLLASLTGSMGGAVGSAASAEALAAVVAGERLITLAVRPAGSGRATLVPAGAVADQTIVLTGDRLLLVPLADHARQQVENLGSTPLADVTVGEDAVELARGERAVGLYEAAIDEWLVLTGAALVGIGAAAHEITCEYARERHAWGVPIGTFQAVAHPLADSATALDGARLLALEAAWSADGGQARAKELAAMAFAFASETARDATYRAVHFHGGYGFTLEQDVQLHYRRARTWARVWGEPAAAYRRAARARYRARPAAEPAEATPSSPTAAGPRPAKPRQARSVAERSRRDFGSAEAEVDSLSAETEAANPGRVEG